eukprot:10716852-Heterocapsa_arctica.AAC.1
MCIRDRFWTVISSSCVMAISVACRNSANGSSSAGCLTRRNAQKGVRATSGTYPPPTTGEGRSWTSTQGGRSNGGWSHLFQSFQNATRRWGGNDPT